MLIADKMLVYTFHVSMCRCMNTEAYEFCHDLVSYTVSTDSSTDVLDWHWQCVWSIESEVNVRAARNDNKKKYIRMMASQSAYELLAVRRKPMLCFR